MALVRKMVDMLFDVDDTMWCKCKYICLFLPGKYFRISEVPLILLYFFIFLMCLHAFIFY